MKPQTGAFLDKARELLDQANTMVGVGLNEPAARTAYLAALHAAQALIFESSSKVVNSHKGVQSEFWRLTKDQPRIDEELRAFLSRAYSFKRIADYEIGHGSYISTETARTAITTARRFVDCVASLMPLNRDTPPETNTPEP